MTTDPTGETGGHTQVTVSYRLTALEPAAAASLDDFERTFPAYVDSWQHQILAVLPAGESTP